MIIMAADRGRFIDQSHLFIAEPTVDKLTAMHFYAWKKGLKTGMYYLRTRPAVNAVQYTVDKNAADDIAGERNENSFLVNPPTQGGDGGACLGCHL